MDSSLSSQQLKRWYVAHSGKRQTKRVNVVVCKGTDKGYFKIYD